MSKKLQPQSTVINRAELKKLFGSPPVLSSESRGAYDATMARFMTCMKPNDFVEQILIKDLTDMTWELMRCERHKSMVIERRNLRQRELKAERKKKAAQKKQALALQEEQIGTPATALEQELALEWVVDSSIHEVDELLERKPEELDHAQALEDGIDYYERLDRLYSTTWARRNDILEQINLYREGLGHQLRRVSDKIIDGEFSVTAQDETPLIPSDRKE
jgi:hypothetical protein